MLSGVISMEPISWIISGLGLLSAFITLWFTVIKPGKKDRHWAFGCIGAFAGVTISILTVVRSLNSAAEIHALKGQVASLQPKPFNVRLLAFLNELGPNATDELTKGDATFLVYLLPSEFNDLERFAREPDAAKYISIELAGIKILKQDGTERTQATIHVKQAILNGQNPTT